jgi:hypothetical protein
MFYMKMNDNIVIKAENNVGSPTRRTEAAEAFGVDVTDGEFPTELVGALPLLTGEELEGAGATTGAAAATGAAAGEATGGG